jgi:hypothetical protein
MQANTYTLVVISRTCGHKWLQAPTSRMLHLHWRVRRKKARRPQPTPLLLPPPLQQQLRWHE